MSIRIDIIGRFGNACFQYGFARALSEQTGEPLIYTPWVGQQLFDLPPSAPMEAGATLVSGYHQDQASLIYTRAQVREWFRFRPEIQEKLAGFHAWPVVAHRRTGDYLALGYPVVSIKSYFDAAEEHGVDASQLVFYSEDSYCEHADFTGELSFLPDFYRMMKAKMLFRGNSSFSWWAATLGDCEVYSPVISGLEGGREHDCRFVRGNCPRLSDLPCCTDLHLSE